MHAQAHMYTHTITEATMNVILNMTNTTVTEALLKVSPVVHLQQPQNKVEYQLGVSLFDAGFKQFFGRQWLGPTMEGRGTSKSKLQYNQV